jgi:hypothetical protein
LDTGTNLHPEVMASLDILCVLQISSISFEDGMVLRDMVEHAAETDAQAWVTFQTHMVSDTISVHDQPLGFQHC